MSPLAAPLAPGQHSTFGIQNSVLVMAGAAAVFCVLLEHTRTGRNLYAMGGNPEASKLASIAVRRYALLALGIPAACAELGAIVATLVGVPPTGVISNGLSIMGGEAFWQYIVQRGVPGRGDVRSGDGDDAEMEGGYCRGGALFPGSRWRQRQCPYCACD